MSADGTGSGPTGSAVAPAEGEPDPPGLGPRPLIGISSCLLGATVRFDGGHKRNPYIIDSLGRHLDFLPFCPETEIGLGVPRQPIRLVERDGSVRVLGSRDPSLDVTAALTRYAVELSPRLDGLSGYIVKRASPSCGMERVRIYRGEQPVATGSGRFTGELMALRPNLPFEEEGRLADPALRDNFLTRVFTWWRWLQLLERGFTPAALLEFHRRHKFLLLAHHEQGYRELGRLAASAGSADPGQLQTTYATQMMAGLKRLAGRGSHANVLQHILGFFKQQMNAGDKAELLDVIDQYRLGQLPLIVPITLINHYLRHHPQEYLRDQIYLEPTPRELLLRNLA